MMSVYFQATVQAKLNWFFTAALRSCEHMAFDRTLDVERNVFEFFVSADYADDFLEFMQFFEQQGIVSNLVQLANRFEQQST